jgi:hypothetical protein
MTELETDVKPNTTAAPSAPINASAMSRSANPGGPVPGSGMDSVRPPAYGRGIFVSLGSSAAVFALAIMASGGHPSATGVPLTETTGPLYWGLAVIVVILTGIGAQYSEITAARAAEALGTPRRHDVLPTAWAVPSVAAATAILMVATYHDKLMLVAGPAIAFFGVAAGLLARDLLDETGEPTQRTATTIHTLVIHSIAFLALSAVYLNKMSNAASVPLISLMTAILVLEALQRGTASASRRIGYALLGAFVLAEATIAVNWWPTHGWTGGAALLVCFFAVCGVLVGQTERSGIRRRDILEYVLVVLAGLVILSLTL